MYGFSMRHLLILAIITASLASTGCATITSGTSQNLTIVTEKEIAGAECKLTDKHGASWYLPTTPGSVTVKKGDGPMTIICKKNGYKPGVLVVEKTLTGATFGNIILGGGIGIFVDAVSGAAQQYPDKITLWLEPEAWNTEEERLAWIKEKEAFLAMEKKESGAQPAPQPEDR